MLLTKLLNTTTFRLAIVYLALFVASAVALLGYVYWNTAGFLSRQTDEAVQAEITGLAEQYEQGGLPLLVHTVIQRSRDPKQNLYLVLDQRGSILAGNLDGRPLVTSSPDGWLEFDYRRKTMEGSEIHAARAREFFLSAGYYLLVGRDVQERREIESLITTSLGWAIGLTIAFGLAGGLFMSRNMMARIDDINRTSREIMRGDLAQRIPVKGTGDELDQLAQNLNAMLEQIETLMVGMRQVADNIAHDLRSPLNRLRNRLEVTLMQRATEQEYRDALERTISEADQLLGTFNALLSIARAEAGTLRESMTSLDISDVVADAVDLYEPLAEESGQTISVSLDPGLRLFGNRELLSQAIVNLLDNAIKHGTPHDQQSQRIDIEAHRAGGSLIVSVSDHGVGIPEADRERVFDRFVRLEASRNTPGSGLGLSLVAAVARLHGGRVELKDNHPGLRASIVLPI